MHSKQETNRISPWPHRMAILLACATFPLIWVGGLVTTYDAGMSVPDWPSTYGYNLFLYPIATWLSGPFDIFVEHGHRLLGAFVGMISIALVILAMRLEKRRFIRRFAVVCLVAVIVQGILGGARVVLNDVAFARIHGVTGPLFFCLTVLMVLWTSKWWVNNKDSQNADCGRLSVLAWVICGLVFGQLVLGANIRHIGYDMQPNTFQSLAVAHLIVALGIVVQCVALIVQAFRRQFQIPKWAKRHALFIALLVGLQVSFGLATWVVKYGWPIWLPAVGYFEGFIIYEKGMLQALIATTHVAVGSIILAASLALAVRLTYVSGYSFSKARCDIQNMNKLEVFV